MLREHIAYLKDNPNNHWFKAKLYGWGWIPVKWQGRAVLGIYIALIITLGAAIDETSPPREVVFTFFLPATLLTITLIRICYKTGEKPRWQWGPPQK